MGLGLGAGLGMMMPGILQQSMQATATGKAPTISCPKCQAQIDPNVRFCPQCGHQIIRENTCPSVVKIFLLRQNSVCSVATKVEKIKAQCPHCGHEILPGSIFCNNCGEKIT